MALSSEIRAGAAYVELKSKDAGFVRGLRKAEKRLQRFGAVARTVGRGLIAGSGSLLAPLALSTRVFAKYGDEVEKMSRRTGLSTEAVSELGFAAEQSGASIAILEKGIRTMQRSIIDAERGLSTQTDALKAMGLTVDDLIGKSPEEQFAIIADAISKIEDPTRKAAAAAQFFGRSGVQLLPLLNGGARGMEELREQARALGLTISNQAAKDAAELTDELNIGRRVVRALAFEVGSALAPSLIKGTKATRSIVKGSIDWVRENKDLVRTVAAVAGGGLLLGTSIYAIGIAAAITSFAVGGLTTIIGALGAGVGILGGVLASVLSPIGLLTAGVVTLSSILLVRSGVMSKAAMSIKLSFGALFQGVSETLSAIKRALMAGDIELAGKIMMKSLEVVWETGISELKSLWIDFEGFMLKSIIKIANAGTAIASGIKGGLSALLNGGDIYQALTGFAQGVGAGAGNPGGILDLIDKNTDDRKSGTKTKLDELLDELRQLRKQIPETGSGAGGLRDFFPELADLQASLGQSTRSTRGATTSATLFSLQGNPIEKKIEENTQKTADEAEALRKYLERTGGGGIAFA